MRGITLTCGASMSLAEPREAMAQSRQGEWRWGSRRLLPKSWPRERSHKREHSIGATEAAVGIALTRARVLPV